MSQKRGDIQMDRWTDGQSDHDQCLVKIYQRKSTLLHIFNYYILHCNIGIPITGGLATSQLIGVWGHS